MNVPKVVKIKRSNGQIVQDCDIYIGRRLCMGGWNLSESKWANPFTVKECGSNEEAVKKYRNYILSKPELLDSLHELSGKTLGCWCKPNPCHGDVLVELFVKVAQKSEEKTEYTHVVSIPWVVGAHTPFSGTIESVIKISIKYAMTATQFFLGNPKTINRTNISSTDITKTKRLLDRFPLHIFSHFPYTSNLAGSKNCLAWNGDATQDTKTASLLKSLEYELSVLSNFKNNGVVIHPGNYTDRERGLLTIAESINKIKFVPNSKLILENSAGQGTSLCTTLEEIKTVIDNVNQKNHIGVCIDTAHIFSVGDYNISKVSEIDRLFSDFDRIIGMKYFTLLHLNDSEVPLSSKKDRHACLETGYIWGKTNKSLIYLLEKCRTHNIPCILETHGTDMFVLAQLAQTI